MKVKNSNQMYVVNGLIGIVQFVVVMYIAIQHFLNNSIVFSQLVPSCVISALVSAFSIEVISKQKFTKYDRSRLLNPHAVLKILGINGIVALLILVL